jgi:methionyl-tRNA synthetase
VSRYLLLPMQPTANGRLHIGHGSGPYLRADMLARSLRRAGNDVQVVTGSDVWENWILLAGMRLGWPPERTCRHFHEAIGRDLRNLDIRLDAWIDPREEEHAEAYHRVHDDLLHELAESGSAELQTETIPVSADSGRAVVGAWLLGECPTCGRDVAGNACVYCADRFEPAEVVAPRSRLDEGPLRWTEVRNWFLTSPPAEQVVAALDAAGVAPVLLDPVERYLRRTGTRYRLSQAGTWGLKSKLLDDGCVLANTYYHYCVYGAEVAARLRGESWSALSPGSDTVVVALFGTDNSQIGLVGPWTIGAASTAVRPFDHVVVSHMLYLEGHKCSTSKDHGIWISEVLSRSSVTADELRFVLAQAPLDEQVAAVMVDGVLERVNALRSWRRERLEPALEAILPADAVLARDGIQTAVERQAAALRPDRVRTPEAVAVLEEWMRRSHDGGESAWLAGLALLAEPVMPELAEHVWSKLGFRGPPALRDLERATAHATEDGLPSWPVTPLTRAELQPLVHLQAE